MTSQRQAVGHCHFLLRTARVFSRLRRACQTEAPYGADRIEHESSNNAADERQRASGFCTVTLQLTHVGSGKRDTFERAVNESRHTVPGDLHKAQEEQASIFARHAHLGIGLQRPTLRVDNVASGVRDADRGGASPPGHAVRRHRHVGQ